MTFNRNDETLATLKATFTATEIAQQPNTWRKTLKQMHDLKDQLKPFLAHVLDKEDYDIILTGAGTSEFVGNAAYAYLTHLFNHKVKSYGTTDIVATPYYYLSTTKPTLLVSYGRSGNSPESVGAVEAADAVCGNNVYHLFITCNNNGALSKAAATRTNAFAIDLTPETHDQSFAMTSSFSNMYLATLCALQLDQLEKIDAAMEQIITTGQNLLDNRFQEVEAIINGFNFNRIVYLGSNVLKGFAQESALKMLELTAGQVVTMYDTPMGFRHGPKSIINDDTLTVVYLSDDPYTHLYEMDLIKEMSGQRKGNKIVAVSNQFDQEVKDLVDYYISFDNNDKLDTCYLGLDYILVAQCIALFKSLALGITPDNPCPTGEVNRVVKGVTIYPIKK